LGLSVSSAGDVNGDGYADVIVGAPGNDAAGTDAGRAYVYYGGPAADAIPDLTLTGAAAGDNFGVSVSSAGDVNGDGYADVIVGAPGNFEAGWAFVYYGGPSADAIADLTLTGEAETAFGRSVSGAGDVNGDGYADVIVGAPAPNYRIDPSLSQAFVYYGGPGADAVADVTLSGGLEALDDFGTSVSSAGDVNGDGYADVIVGADDAGSGGAGYSGVFYGGPAMDTKMDLFLHDGNWSFGSEVSSAGDVNKDGYADLIVGTLVGRADVFFGGPISPANGDSTGSPAADLVPDVILTTGNASGYFGSAVSSAGDVNGDGYGDVIVGEPLNGPGKAYVYYGGLVMDASADAVLSGETAGDAFGGSVKSAGDVNGDGLADVIVGAYGNDEAADRAGRAYVFSVQPSVLETTIDLDPNAINLKSHAPWLTAYIEPSGFDPSSIDLSTLRLAGSVPAVSKFAIVGDHNRNGMPDLMVKFSRIALDPLLTPGMVDLEVTGSLVTGENFTGSDEVRVIDPPAAHLSASVTPNPLNPAGVLSFETSRPGPVKVSIFDVRGRKVRVLMDVPTLPAGSHVVPIDGRGARGQTLASGLYFFRVEAAEEAVTGRIVIMK
jgi:hypothetical protein